jgi:hypothetical protein
MPLLVRISLMSFRNSCSTLLNASAWRGQLRTALTPGGAAGFVVKVSDAQELPFWRRILYDEDGDVGFVGPLYAGSETELWCLIFLIKLL